MIQHNFIELSAKQVLAQAEDAEDVLAADRAIGEIREEMNDFDEDIPIEGEAPLVCLLSDLLCFKESYFLSCFFHIITMNKVAKKINMLL